MGTCVPILNESHDGLVFSVEIEMMFSFGIATLRFISEFFLAIESNHDLVFVNANFDHLCC
jgi:hypothetical protein